MLGGLKMRTCGAGCACADPANAVATGGRGGDRDDVAARRDRLRGG
jgi:hypothetical protein